MIVNLMVDYVEELRHFWARALGIAGPQWLILMAVADLEDDSGVPDYAVANLLQVHASFVRTQSSTLEKRGFLRRQLIEDGKVMRFSLTTRARKHMDRFTRLSNARSL